MSENDKLRKLIASSGRTTQEYSPYYMQNDIEPPQGGKSLLHDENGRPLYKKHQQNQSRVPEQTRNEDFEVIRVKGTRNSDNAVQAPTTPMSTRELNPSRTASNPSPPQERFQPSAKTLEEIMSESAPVGDMPVHVGNHDEHNWYDQNVTGSPDSQDDRVIDNNEYVNVEALQNTQRLPNTDQEREQLEQQQKQASWSDNNPPRPVIADVINGIDQGEMCVLMKGDPVFLSSDSVKVVRFIEDAMMKHEISISDISVIKKMGLDFGLTME